MFKKDTYWVGILIGTLAPLILYALLFAGLSLYNRLSASPFKFDLRLLQLLSTIINLFFLRYYFVTKKYDETGRGILLVTFIFVIAFFIINGIFF